MMKPVLKTVLTATMSCLMLGSVALAAGPIDGEIGAVWWSNDLDTDSGSIDASAPAYRGELWLFDRYGVRAGQYMSNPDGNADGTDTTSVDVMWRAWAPSENNFVAAGMGWQMMHLDGLGIDDNTSGMRLSVEGRVGLMNMLYAYGQGSYLPSLDDAGDALARTLEDMDGHEYELGVSWKMAPFVSMRAGYRVSGIDFTQVSSITSSSVDGPSNEDSGGAPAAVNFSLAQGNEESGSGSSSSTSGSVDSKGFFLGFGFNF